MLEAIVSSGLVHYRVRLTINLELADLRMEGPVYDLDIVVSIMLASKHASENLFSV